MKCPAVPVRPPQLICRIVLFGLVAFGGAGVGSASEPWIKVESPDFTIYSDASEKSVTECAVEYAAFRKALRELFVPPGRTLAPSVLILFRLQSSFDDLIQSRPKPNGMIGVNYQAEVDGTPYITFAADIDRRLALAHAYEFETIWALQQLGYFVPIWMSQGAGEVLSDLKIRDGQCLVGGLQEHSFRTDLNWPHFFEINQTSITYYDPKRLANYLGQAWGLMHWVLLKDPGTRERFAMLADKLHTMNAVDAVAVVMATPPGGFNRTISRHLVDSDEPRAIKFDEKAVRAGLHVQPAAEAEVLAQTATVLSASGQTRRGDALLDRARRLAPTLDVVQEAWARRLVREGRQSEAVAAYRAAIAAGSRDTAAYVISATSFLDDASTGGRDVPGQGGFMANLAVTQLRAAIKLNPGNLLAYRQLGRAFYVAPTVTAADAAELAGGVGPGEAGSVVRFYRAMLYARLKRTADCRADLQALADDPGANDKIRQLAAAELHAR